MQAKRTSRRSVLAFVACITGIISISLLLGTRSVPAQNSGATTRPLTPQEGVPRFGHVFLIIGENTTYEHLNSTNAPYLMDTIRPNAAWLTQYYAA